MSDERAGLRLCGGCAPAGGLGAIGPAELGHDVRHVHAGGLGGDEQVGGNVAVGPSGGDQAQHLELAIGQSGPVRPGLGLVLQLYARSPGERGDRVGERSCAELGERVRQRGQLLGPPDQGRAQAATHHDSSMPAGCIGGLSHGPFGRK